MKHMLDKHIKETKELINKFPDDDIGIWCSEVTTKLNLLVDLLELNSDEVLRTKNYIGLINLWKVLGKYLTDEERNKINENQKLSYSRSLKPCEHGLIDWEDCSECREANSVKTNEINSQGIYRHFKTQGDYRIIGTGKIQISTSLRDMDDIVIYQSLVNSDLWGRGLTEFLNRFNLVKDK